MYSLRLAAIIILATTLAMGASQNYEAFKFPTGYGFPLCVGGCRSINSSGQVIGTDAGGQAFLWSRQAGYSYIGSLGGGVTMPFAINDNGTVVGKSTLSDGTFHAFLWTEAGGMQDLGSIEGGESEAVAINNSDQVAGQSADQGGYYHAFFWSQATGSIDIGIPSGYLYTESYVLNENGVVAGLAVGSTETAFTWSLSAGILVLPCPGAWAAPYAINSTGQIVGVTVYTGGPYNALLWSPDGTVQDLGTLPSDNGSMAYFINDGGACGRGLFELREPRISPASVLLDAPARSA